MTVKEMIEELQKFPQESEVRLWDYTDERYRKVGGISMVRMVNTADGCYYEWWEQFNPRRHDPDGVQDGVQIY